MDYALLNEIVEKYPLTIYEEDGTGVEFKTFPTYQDIADLCARNPQIIPEDDVVAGFQPSQNSVLNSLDTYQVALEEADALGPKMSAALQDLIDCAEDIHRVNNQLFMDKVLVKAGEDAELVLHVYNGLVMRGRDLYEAGNKDGADIYAGFIEYMQDCFPSIAGDEDEDPSGVDAFTEAAADADDDVHVIQLEIQGEIVDVPLNEEGIELAAQAEPLMDIPFSEVMEFYNPDILEPIYAGNLIGLIAAKKDGLDEKSELWNALDAAEQMAVAFYDEQIFNLIDAYLDEVSLDEAKEASANLALWVERLMLVQEDDLPEVDLFTLSLFHTELREQIVITEAELAKDAARAMEDAKHDKTVFVQQSAVSLNFH